MLQRLDEVSVPITKHAEIFNGIQTSAERPTPIYWFSSDEIVAEYADTVEISRDGNNYTIEKALLRPYFKPTKKAEKGLNSYSILATDKQIIFLSVFPVMELVTFQTPPQIHGTSMAEHKP